jgi:transcriptional regulator with XRE-family HTH domain
MTGGLTQRLLAVRSGVPEKRISSYERGTRRMPLAAAEQILAAFGLQLTLGTEPRDADLDRHIAEHAALAIGTRLARMGPRLTEILHWLRDVEPIVDGLAAAALLGVPARVDHLDLRVARQKLDALATAFAAFRPVRWSDRLGEWSLLAPPDPRAEGAMRWRSHLGELCIHLCDDLPETITVQVPYDEYAEAPVDVRVVTLAAIGGVDTSMARLVDRVIERSRAHAADAA